MIPRVELKAMYTFEVIFGGFSPRFEGFNLLICKVFGVGSVRSSFISFALCSLLTNVANRIHPDRLRLPRFFVSFAIINLTETGAGD